MESMKCSLLTTHSHRLLYSLNLFYIQHSRIFSQVQNFMKMLRLHQKKFSQFLFLCQQDAAIDHAFMHHTSLLRTFKKFLETLTWLPTSPGHSIPLPRKAAQLCILVGLIASHHHQQKMTKLIFSICSLYSCKIGQFSVVQHSQQETKIYQGLFYSFEICNKMQSSSSKFIH